MASKTIKKSVRVTTAENDKILLKIGSTGFENFSDYAREVLQINDAQASKKLAKKAEGKENLESLRLLKSLTNNINQIAQALHIIKKSADKSSYDFAKFDEILKECRELQGKILVGLK